MWVSKVRLSKAVKKELWRLPKHVVQKLMAWVDAVENEGLQEVRKIKGYHDEPLSGYWSGRRSIRLSRSYRAYYIIKVDRVEFVEVIEVNKHEY